MSSSFSDAKLKEAPAWLGRVFGGGRFKQNVMCGVQWYHNKYIRPGTFKPIVHAILLIGVTGYLMRYDHTKHDANARHH